MSHQPFETWLFSGETLETNEEQSLTAHLRECEYCAALSDALIHVSETFNDIPAPNPTPGFTQRWHTRLAIQRQQRQHRNMWIFTMSMFGVAGLIFVIMLLLNVNSVNWSYELGKFFANIGLAAAQIRRVWHFFNSLIGSFPILIPILFVTGMSFFVGMCALSVTWFSSIIKLYQPNHEGDFSR